MKISVTKGLYLGFAAAFIISLVSGVTLYLSQRNQVERSEWVKHTYQTLNSIKAVQTTLADMETGRRGYRATNIKDFLEPYNNGLANINPQIAEVKKLLEDNPGQKQKANVLEEKTNRLLAFWKHLGEDKTSYTSSRDSLIQITATEKIQMDSIRSILDDMLKVENNLLEEREKENETAIAESAYTSIGSGIIVQVIIIILLVIIFREFKNRKVAEQSLQDNLVKLEELNNESTNQNWLLAGLASVNNSLQGNNSTAAIINNILTSIIKYLELPAGALYLTDESRELLELKGSIGVPPNKPTSYIIKQLPGGVPPKNEVKIIKNVPAFFWQLETALGASVPGEVAIIPLYFNNELLGAIELANFAKFSEQEIELLKATGNNLGLALNTAISNEKVLSLLNQVQVQKETLENQQEELRQSNEELMRQTEVLQASEEELKVQEEELRHINTELEEKNEAVETARQALQEKAKELDEISRYKSEFLANMSHELRTPLNSILILANMLADNKGKNLTVKQVEYSNIIHKSGTDLLNLINDILDLSKIEAGKINIQIEETSIGSMVDDITPPFTILAESKKLHFYITIANEVPKYISTDKQRLEQIIKNLLSNAFKFTPEGGSITLAFSVAGNLLHISVKDTGVGIPADKQRLIFEAFQQADGSTSRKYGGTGLGLSISRELIRILGGQITLESEQHVGSTFTIRLPLQVQAATITPTEVPVKVITSIPEDIKQQTQLSDDRDNLEPGDKTMLIIEDDTKFAFILQTFARERNFKTIIALSGDEGLVCASKYMPSAIILDIQLPVLDGWSILKALKSNDKLKNIPVHIISVDDSSTGQAEGAIAYLKKPVTREGLEKAFTDIAGHIQGFYKKILFFSEEGQKNEGLQKLLDSRKMDASVTYVNTLQQAIEMLKESSFDCVIVDIGHDINPGIEKLNSLKTAGVLDDTQTIICLDKDISREDEWRLKKFSNVVIRDSAHAQQRLIDEMELFLHKIQQVQKAPLSQAGIVTDSHVFEGKKVLLVDDDMRNVFALSVALEEHNMVVVTANDGKEALDMLKQNKDVAIVLMDIMMPEMDGYEAMQHIRKTMQLTKLPIIALTAKAMQGDRERSIEAGASDYITKPVDMGRLLSLMRVWLSQ